MFKALGKTWMIGQKQPENVFSERQLQQPLLDPAGDARAGTDGVPAGGREGTGYSLAASLGPAPILGALSMLLPGILESTWWDGHGASSQEAGKGQEKWPS